MKHKRAISWLLVVTLMVSNTVIMPASAANYVLDSPALTAPDFDEATFNSEESAFVANYDKFIDPTESLKLKWENVGAKNYEIWIKGLNGLPNPGDNEDGKIIRHEKTSKTSMTIDSNELEEWAGHFVKIALQAQDGNDISYMGWYYLELDEIREAESYTVKYKKNGGDYAPSSTSTDEDGWFTVSNKTPTRDGYEFLGWSIYKNNDEAEYEPGEDYQIDEDITLYAVWEKENVQQIKPTLKGFDSDEIRIQVGEKITLTGTISAGDSSGAKLNKVTVKHNKTGTAYPPVTVNVNAASYNLSRLPFSRFTEPGEYEMVLYASATNYTVTENDIVTFTVIVEEKPVKYSVTYNANGGNTPPDADTTDKNGWFIVSDDEPIRDGYNFLGWSDSRSSSEIKYVPDEEYQINKNVTLYAVWEKKTAQQIKPVLEDFDSDEIRIQVNEKITLTGTISAGGSSGAKLNKVTVKHNKTGTTYSPVSANVNAASYDLSKLSFGRFTKPGEYEMVLYASATNYTVKENDIVTFTVIVSGKEYDVEYDENGGIGAPESQIKQAGTDLILSKEKPSRPDYQFQGWATTKNGKVKYQPGDAYSDDKALTLYAVWEELPNSLYRDIDNHWGYKYICDVTDLGLMSGISNTEFKPNSPMTRQMFASALASLSKVNKNIESWLKANKIMAGYSNGDMGWDDAITREQMALMLVKYLKAEHQSISGKDVNSYEDHKDISTWASDAVYEIQKSALMTGGTGNRFNPKANTTRAEAAVILSNLAKLVDSGCHHIFVTESKPITDSGKWRDNGDGKTHSRYEVNYNRYCQLCGRKSSILPVTDSVTQNHDFSNAETSVTYQYVDSSFHQKITTETKTCWVCPAQKITTTTTKESHNYHGNGYICSAAGCSIPPSTATAASAWKNVWNHIEKNRSKIEYSLDPDPLYKFEAFVETYRDSTYEQAWTAALSSVEIAKETLPALVKVIELNTDHLLEALGDLFSSDAKVAQLIVDYLYTNDFSAIYESIEGAEAVNDVYEILQTKPVSNAIDMFIVKNMDVRSVTTAKRFKLGDLLNITENNYEDIYDNIEALRDSGNKFDLSDLAFVQDVYVDTPSKLGNKVQEKLGQRIVEEHGDSTFEVQIPGSTAKKLLKGAEVFSYLLQPILSGIGTYNEYIKYEAVLNQYEQQLSQILTGAGCKSTEKIVTKVMDTLTDAVADGIVLTIEKELFADVGAGTIELMVDISCFPLAVIDIETMILGIAANTSETFCKVWSIEDLYEDFQLAEKALLKAVQEFYHNPSDATYNRLEANYAYYALLVASGANVVSNILINDAESGLYKFKNWIVGMFDGSDVDWRIEQIKYAKTIPAADEKTLLEVKARIFP